MQYREFLSDKTEISLSNSLDLAALIGSDYVGHTHWLNVICKNPNGGYGASLLLESMSVDIASIWQATADRLQRQGTGTSSRTPPTLSGSMRLRMRRAMQLAMDQGARSLESQFVLMALLWDGGDPLLDRCGVRLDALISASREVLGVESPRSEPPLEPVVGITPVAALIDELACSVSRSRGNSTVGSADFLIALARAPGIAAKLLHDFGCTSHDLERRLNELEATGEAMGLDDAPPSELAIRERGEPVALTADEFEALSGNLARLLPGKPFAYSRDGASFLVETSPEVEWPSILRELGRT